MQTVPSSAASTQTCSEAGETLRCTEVFPQIAREVVAELGLGSENASFPDSSSLAASPDPPPG